MAKPLSAASAAASTVSLLSEQQFHSYKEGCRRIRTEISQTTKCESSALTFVETWGSVN